MKTLLRLMLLTFCLSLALLTRTETALALEQLGRARPVNQPPPPRKALSKPVMPPAVDPKAVADEQADATNELAVSPGSMIVLTIPMSSLSGESLGRLKAQYLRISALDKFQDAGKVTTNDVARFREAITNACPILFVPMRRSNAANVHLLHYGINVALHDDMQQALNNPEWTPDDAHALVKDFCRLLQLQGMLSSLELDAEARTTLQDEHTVLLNKFFARRNPPPKPPPPPSPKKTDDD